ncbi:MAG TPA: thioredoxin domain-containing protein [Solirubrobacterales bacterium]|nr:thioredoxin domain-containing protein [Solirubrobacterales bacterium]
MANNQRSREKRREERIAAEAQAAGGERRTRLLQFAAGGVFLAIIVVVVVIIAVGSGGSSGGDASNLVEKANVEKLLAGIPQNATKLGKAGAPVKLYEYGDLQCPICKEYSEEVLPEIIENQVKKGEVSITFRNFIIIGPQSIPAGEAALAAGAQGKGWNFIETWYRNQGEENSGYATDEFIESMAKYVGIPDMAKWKQEWKGKKYKKQVESTTSQAQTLGFTGTPSFSIEGPKSEGLELLGTPGSTEAIEEAIEKAS